MEIKILKLTRVATVATLPDNDGKVGGYLMSDYVDHNCQNCGTAIGIYSPLAKSPKCPGCGDVLKTAKSWPKTHIRANTKCDQCGDMHPLVSAVGEDPKCPSCGTDI